MRKPSQWVLKAILNRCPENRRAALEHYLPEAERIQLQAMPFFKVEMKAEAEEPQILDKIHWSWFLPCLKSYAPQEQRLFLTVLPESFRKNLSHEIGLPPLPAKELGSLAKRFFTQTLLDHIASPIQHILPIDFLPPSPLTPLLHLTKKKLIHLVDFLSLFDLAAELRQIVETKILKKIYSFLSEKEREFLKQTAASNLPFPSTRLKFEGWDGTGESFRTLLHKRGLARLGAALSAQLPDFCWYICHRLDIGRGTVLSKLCLSEVSRETSEAIVRQIEAALQRKDIQ